MNDNNTTSFWKDAINAIGGLLTKNNRDLLTVLEQPTPVKISSVQQASATGVIGGGLANPQPVPLYQCPMSHEAWVNRISISAYGFTPGSPLQAGQGQIWVSGSTAGEPIFWLPIAGVIAPIQITEGRASAPHLNPGESMMLSADSLPANQQLRFDFQIILVQGVSEYTPRNQFYSKALMGD